MPPLKDLKWRLAEFNGSLAEFEHECELSKHTDTGALWELMNQAAALMTEAEHELERRDKATEHTFIISSVHRTDLIEREVNGKELTHEDVMKISDRDMQDIASVMAECLTETGAFWDALDHAAERVLDNN